MADEVAYGAAGGDSNKRKYEDLPSPVARRVTGFSSPLDSAPPPSSYNSVPPPMNEIEAAKQKAQEIAARLLNNADPSKRARVENGAGVGGGYDAADAGSGQKHLGLGLSGPPPSASYGYPGPSKKIEVPNGRVGVIIGKGGETIKYLQTQSGAKIQVTRDVDADPNAPTRAVEITGTQDQIAKAEKLINDILSEADTGGSGMISRRLGGQSAGADPFVMMVPNNKVGLVIGKGGETIKNMQARTGARIQVIPLHLPPGDTSKERTVQIDGTREQIEAAKQLVEEVTSEMCRSTSLVKMIPRWKRSAFAAFFARSGYCLASGFAWILSVEVTKQHMKYLIILRNCRDIHNKHQFYSKAILLRLSPLNRMRNQPMGGGYSNPQQGYQARPPTNWNQQGPPMQQPNYGYNYPGPPQYNMNQQPNYPNYPPTSGWDQSGAPQNPQGGSNYNYSQVGQTDGSAYNYGQAQAYSQGQVSYGPDGYGGGYNTGTAGYNQPPPVNNPSGGGYDGQQQQGGGGYNANADGSNPSYGDATNPSQAAHQGSGYGPPPPTSQAGYGTPQPTSGFSGPQAQKPTSGGQPSYGQWGGGYAQSGYPHSQTDAAAAAAQRPPAYGYPQYGQQPYGGGYSQPAAYSTDAEPSQPVAGSAKASPPS
ncbi:KH domain-containing protein [Striga asiatica]|uniref:KH domain-containing protein n=1 Tax=Striga asiatica TaxID=4170 RepID=A0A5A7RG07_STRAF|nr:KH domain-containing protein [Striga asiatica]